MPAGEWALWRLIRGREGGWFLVNVVDDGDNGDNGETLSYYGERGRNALSLALVGAEVRELSANGSVIVSIKAEQLVGVRDAAVLSL